MYEQFKDDKSCSVAMNQYTGEVLALVSTPSFNSNDFVMGMSDKLWKSLNEDERQPLYNRFRQVWCPGSTFKPVTAVIGLDTGILDPVEDYGNEGLSWQKDSSWGDYYVTTLHETEPATLENAMIYSDNIYFAKVALKLGENNLTSFLEKLGFNKEIPFDIKMSISQYSNTEGIKSEIQLADSGYGQGQILINPLHLASIYSAFSNDGNIIEPTLLYNPNYNPNIWMPEVIQKESIHTVLETMKKVISEPTATGYGLHREEYTLAGKTGTAEIKLSKEDATGTELGWMAVFTTDPNIENPILLISMVEDVKNIGGSGYVVQKDKNGSQNDLIINNTEEENVVMDENDDYELKNIEMGRKEEKDISDRLRKMVGKCKRIYSQADKGNASNIVLEEETVHTMIESIAEENVAITCGSHDYNMLNYKQVDDALSLAKTGENTETEFFVINTSGVWIYNKLQFKNKDLYVTSATAAFDDNMSPHIVQIEKIQVYDWNYTDKGWIIWEKALSRNQEMDMHVFYRILPLDEQCRELGNKCITPVSYFCNNLFLVDWNQNSLENIEFNDLFEFLYTMKYGEKIDEKKYASGIPKVEFEEVVTTYFDISIETLEIYAQYDDVKGVYPWEAIGPWNRIQQFQPFPEVVNCIANEDGSLTLTVEAVFQEEGTDCSFRHEVTIREEGDKWIYLGNCIEREGAYKIPEYKPRRDF